MGDSSHDEPLFTAGMNRLGSLGDDEFESAVKPAARRAEAVAAANALSASRALASWLLSANESSDPCACHSVLERRIRAGASPPRFEEVEAAEAELELDFLNHAGTTRTPLVGRHILSSMRRLGGVSTTYSCASFDDALASVSLGVDGPTSAGLYAFCEWSEMSFEPLSFEERSDRSRSFDGRPHSAAASAATTAPPYAERVFRLTPRISRCVTGGGGECIVVACNGGETEASESGDRLNAGDLHASGGVGILPVLLVFADVQSRDGFS